MLIRNYDDVNITVAKFYDREDADEKLKLLEQKLKHTMNRNHWKSGPISKRRTTLC